MKYLKHAVASLVIFAVLVGLVINFYDGIESQYGIIKGDQKTIQNLTTGNIMDQFKEMNLLEGIQQINNAVFELNPGSSSTIDILGALASLAIGILKSVVGLLTAPYSIMSIILTYYAGEIPGVVGGLVAMVVVYVGFILLYAYLRTEV